MRIKKILTQHRRDLTCLFICEHCGHTHESRGYDDRYFHTVVVPDLQCTECKRVAPADFQPLTPKYPEGVQV